MTLVPVINMLILALATNLPIGAAVFLLASTFFMAAFFGATILRGATAIKPKYSRLISGLVGTAANIGFLISPYVVENVTKNQTRREWTTMFFILAAVFFTSWIIYLPIRFENQRKNKIQPIQNLADQSKNETGKI